MKKYYLLLILLLSFSTTVYAAEYHSPMIKFNGNTTIKYLTESDKNTIMDKFALAEYDGAVIYTNNPSISLFIDYGSINANYYGDYFDYNDILDDQDAISPRANYICSNLYDWADEYRIYDVKRENDKPSFGLMYDINDSEYICGNQNTHGVDSNLSIFEFQHEGLYVAPDYDMENPENIGKLFIYYVANDSNAKLQFSSSKTVTETTITGYTDLTDEPYISKNVVREIPPTKSYGLLHDTDREDFANTVGLDYYGGELALMPTEGFNLKFDFDKSTIKANDFVMVMVEYFNMSRDDQGYFLADDYYSETYRYAHGKLFDADGTYSTLNVGASIESGIPIHGMNGVELYDEVCNGNSCNNVISKADYVMVSIYSLDTDGWRAFNFAYDTQENYELFNFDVINDYESQYLKGDMNKNEKIDLSDIITLLKVYLNGSPTEEEIQIGDMDDNGSIGLNDIIALLKLYLAN